MTLFHPLRRCVRCTGQSSHLPLRACSAIVALRLLADPTDGGKPLHYIQVGDSHFTAAVALLTIFDAGRRFIRTLDTGPERIGTTKKAADSGCLGCFQVLALLVHLINRCSLSFLFPFLGELVHLVHVNCPGCLIHVALHTTRCPIRSFNLSGLSTLKTLWLNSLTNTTCSPSPRHFFPHCSWPTPAPLAPHFESLTQPFSHLSLGALDFAGARTANAPTRNNTQPTHASP